MNLNFHMIEQQTKKDKELHQMVKTFFSLEELLRYGRMTTRNFQIVNT